MEVVQVVVVGVIQAAAAAAVGATILEASVLLGVTVSFLQVTSFFLQVAVFLRQTAVIFQAVEALHRMSTIPGSPSPLTSAPQHSPLQPLTSVSLLPSSISSSTDVATLTSISLSTESESPTRSSLGRTLSATQVLRSCLNHL